MWTNSHANPYLSNPLCKALKNTRKDSGSTRAHGRPIPQLGFSYLTHRVGALQQPQSGEVTLYVCWCALQTQQTQSLHHELVDMQVRIDKSRALFLNHDKAAASILKQHIAKHKLELQAEDVMSLDPGLNLSMLHCASQLHS
jgi:hypothetical protein